MTEQNELQNVVVTANISSMSKKISDTYKRDDPKITVYLRPKSDDDSKKLTDLGLTQYTPKTGDDKTPFFVVQLPKHFRIFRSADSSEQPETLNGTVEGGTLYKSKDENTYFPMVITKGNKNKNDFYRLSSILVENPDDFVKIESNPFAPQD